MKKFFIIASVLLAAVACKQGLDIENSAQEIVIGVGDSFKTEFETKATAVTTIPASLYYCIRYSDKNQVVKSPSSAAVSGGKIATGLFKNPSDSYKYYVSNVNFDDGGIFTCDGTVDVIAGLATSQSNSPEIPLIHIYARTGSLTLNTPTGYTASGIEWHIRRNGTQLGGTSGTYNINSQGATPWTSTSGLQSNEVITSSSDLYIIPGTYIVGVSYTLSKPGWSQTFNHEANITFVGNKINNIIGTATFRSGENEPNEITMNLSLTDWTEVDIPADF